MAGRAQEWHAGYRDDTNQDNPLMTGIGYTGDIPILGIDVWEHGRR